MNQPVSSSSSQTQAMPTVDGRSTTRLLEVQTDRLVLGIDQTNYRLHLQTGGQVDDNSSGKRINGRIVVSVWKVDLVSVGGSYIEPVIGRPRRVQGRVLGLGDGPQTIVVQVAGVPIVAQLPQMFDPQRLQPGQKVGLDVYDGASFEPA